MAKTISKGFGHSRLLLGCAAALLGGAGALGYEVVWSKILVVPLGNSADATAIVLAAFMLGMALGAALLGRLGDQRTHPLRLYAALELGLAMYAIFAPRLLFALSSLRLGEDSMMGSQWLKLATATALVAAPAMAMGAAVPLLLKGLTGGEVPVARRVGLVYGFNTLGAALGALLAGYYAIPTWGLSATSLVAGAASLGCAALAFLCDLFPDTSVPLSESAEKTAPSTRAAAAFALVAAAACGAITMGAEVLWARLLTFVFGHDTYAFAALLTVVLFGLSLGGWTFHLWGRRDPLRFATAACGWLGAFLLLCMWATAGIVITHGRDPLGLEGSWLGSSLALEALRELVLCPVLVGLPALASGALLPAAIALFSRGEQRIGARVGLVLFVNGCAGALGSLVVSFGLIEWMGIERSLFLLSGLALVAGTAGLMLNGKWKLASFRSHAVLAGPLAIGLAIAVIMPADLPRALLLEGVGAKHQNLAFYKEGRTSTVSITVNKISGEKQLFVNAVNEVTTRLVHDQSFKLLGHLGLLVHRQPKKALMICLGAGLAAGAALTHPISSLDIAELSSAVPHAAALWRQENNGALDDPLTHLAIADGRHYLASSQGSYDVIIVDSTHPKSVDSWLLYTKEFYELSRSRLGPGGVLVQWVPLHGLSEREFKIIVRTFQSVFPETTLWANVGFETYGQAAYLKLVGTREPLIIDFSELELRLKEPRIAADLAPYGMDSPIEILDTFLANPEAVAEWTRGLPVQRDDHPIVPYITRYTSGRRMEAPLLLAVRTPLFGVVSLPGERSDALAKELEAAYDASGFLLAGLLDRAEEAFPTSRKIPLYKAQLEGTSAYYGKLAQLYEDHPDKLFEIGSYLGNLGHSAQAEALFQKALAQKPRDPRARLNLALLHLDLDELDTALRELEGLYRDHPSSALVQYNLAVALRRGGQWERAIELLLLAKEQLEATPGVVLALAGTYLDSGQKEEAAEVLEAFVRREPFDAEAFDMLGLLAAAEGNYEAARANHVRALALEPYRRDSHFNLGLALTALGRFSEAHRAFSFCLYLDPKDADAAFNLGVTSEALGNASQAAAYYNTALGLMPDMKEAKARLQRLVHATP
ncbi:MAG: tetratricopeptide repeat protein [Myxococcota bacterium]|nr:tetratricopeptide repeat protein [Myxococcota bacterium]